MTNSPTQFEDNAITLPQRMEFEGSSTEGDVCIRFLRHLSAVPSQDACVKLIASIQFVADIMGYSDAHISKILVEHGLRAPCRAFPQSYIEHVSNALHNPIWQSDAPAKALTELTRHWHALGEDAHAAGARA